MKIAQINLYQGEGLKGYGSLGLENADPSTSGTLLNKIISTTVGVLTSVIFIYFVVSFFAGALAWITAGGDQKKVEGARKKLTNSLIGLVIAVAAIFLIELVGRILGVDILRPDALLNLV